ncbi:MAG: sulfotransferase [Cyanobacteriota bacterium]|nr:sulfotransferase [Cyanobacteriota bacterium]
MSGNIKGRIFIVGCPRTGTTLLQSLLAAHPQIASFPESHFFESLAPANPLIRSLGVGLASGQRSKKRFKHFLSIIDREEMEEYLPSFPLFMNQYASAFVKVLDRLTEEQDKSLWIEKTPGHLRQIELIEKLVKEAKFLHIVRNGADSVASLYQVSQKHSQWGGAKDIDECIRRWREDVEITLNYLPKANHALVRYEELVANTKEAIADVCQFLNVPFEAVMLQEYGNAAQKVVRKDESWKASVGEPIQNANGRKFNQLFDEKQREYILEQISKIDIEKLSESSRN